jgi:hypothetical protein
LGFEFCDCANEGDEERKTKNSPRPFFLTHRLSARAAPHHTLRPPRRGCFKGSRRANERGAASRLAFGGGEGVLLFELLPSRLLRNTVQKETMSAIVSHKLVLLGDTSVGKSCLVVRFCRGDFYDYQEPTIGGE